MVYTVVGLLDGRIICTDMQSFIRSPDPDAHVCHCRQIVLCTSRLPPAPARTYAALPRGAGVPRHLVGAARRRLWRPCSSTDRARIHGYLECGTLAHGFACTRCADCGHDFIIAFIDEGDGRSQGNRHGFQDRLDEPGGKTGGRLRMTMGGRCRDTSRRVIRFPVLRIFSLSDSRLHRI